MTIIVLVIVRALIITIKKGTQNCIKKKITGQQLWKKSRNLSGLAKHMSCKKHCECNNKKWKKTTTENLC